MYAMSARCATLIACSAAFSRSIGHFLVRRRTSRRERPLGCLWQDFGADSRTRTSRDHTVAVVASPPLLHYSTSTSFATVKCQLTNRKDLSV